MQDALGADLTYLTWSAQPSSNDLAKYHGLISYSCIAFAPLIEPIARRTDAMDGNSRGRRSRGPLSRQYPVRHADSSRLDIALSGRSMMEAINFDGAARRRLSCASELFRDARRRVSERPCAR